MLTGRKLVFIGGDARQIEVIALATELDASATLIGFEDLHRSFPDTVNTDLTVEALASADAIVLPVAGMDDDGRVDSRFSQHPVFLERKHFSELRPGTLVFSGIGRVKLETWCDEYQLRLVKLMELDEVAILNSIPTAEGAIALGMQHTEVTIHGSVSVVLGFGRCGITLARSLTALGAEVRVAARKPAHLARIREMGLQPIPVEGLPNGLEDADIVFNTVPVMVLSAAVLAQMRKECVVIDIASKPGGTDFRFAEKRGMTAILAPSLPGLVAPKTAGRIIADTLCRIVAEHSQTV